jgi:beta-lactamase superfamily II metal-dependent hydrolase
MYRVGFGDCFLVSIPGDRHVLVDCGVHVAADIGVLDDVLANIALESRGRLDLVIASHPHEDHISGFARGEETFRSLKIGEIWLPWTEDPTDADAYRLRQARAGLAAALTAHAAAAPVRPEVEAILANAAARRNETAMNLLRSAFGTEATVRFLAAGASFDEVAGIPGLAARLLGPPRSEAFLKSMDPPRIERYLRAAADGGQELVGAVEPFGKEWVERPERGPRLTERDRRRLVRAVESSPDMLAFALDRAVNNTSLVCLFSYRGRSLLFPGDAQYGSWKAWLQEPDSPALLGTVDFYKVSHHGSENATPKSAVERMLKDSLSAMASTQSTPWPSIPHEALWTALELQTKGRLARSDVVLVANAPVHEAPAALPDVFERGDFWIDWRIQL